MTSRAPHFHYLEQTNSVQEPFKVWVMSSIFAQGHPRRGPLLLTDPFQQPWMLQFTAHAMTSLLPPQVILRVKTHCKTSQCANKTQTYGRRGSAGRSYSRESASSPSKMGLTDSVIENTHTSTAFGKGCLSCIFLLSIRYHRVKN